MLERVIAVIDDFSVTQLNKLMIIYINRPKDALKVFPAIEQRFLKEKDKFPREAKTSIFQNFVELGVGSDNFYEDMKVELIN